MNRSRTVETTLGSLIAALTEEARACVRDEKRITKSSPSCSRIY